MIGFFDRKLRPVPMAAAESGDDPLVAATCRIAAATDLDAVIAALRDTARGVVGSDGITIVRRDGDDVVYVSEDAISPLWTGQRFPIRICVSGMAIQARAAIVIPDILQDRRVPLNAYIATFVRAMAMVPVGRHDPQMAIGAYWQAAQPIADITVDRLSRLADAAADALARIEGIADPDRQVA